MNVVYDLDPDYEYKDKDWEIFEKDVEELAKIWGVSVAALRQLHRRGAQQKRFTQAAHNRLPYDQARGALFSSEDPETLKTLKAVFKDLHARCAESVLKVSPPRSLCTWLSSTEDPITCSKSHF